MKLAFVIDQFVAQAGGAERCVMGFATFCAQHGHDVHIVARRADAPGLRCRIHPVAVPAGLRALREVWFAVRSARVVRRERCDAVLGFGRVWQADLVQPHGGSHRAWFWRDLRAIEAPGLRILTGLRRFLSPKQWLALWLEQRLYRRGGVRRVVAISRLVAEDLRRDYHVDPTRLSVVHNGVDVERFHPRIRDRHRASVRERLGIGRDAVLLFAANNFRLKGLAAFLRVVAALGTAPDGRRVRAVVAGRGRVDPYRRLARRLGCATRVHFVGPVAGLEPFYAAADVLLQPTFYDACSLTTLEALAMGVPVVTTRLNGAGELITNGVEGYVVEHPRDTTALIGAVRDILAPGLWPRFSAAARGRAEGLAHDTVHRELLRIVEAMGRAGG